MSKMMSVACKTTGRNIMLHEAWEVALVDVAEPNTWHAYQVPLDTFMAADPDSLRASNFWTRYAKPENGSSVNVMGEGDTIIEEDEGGDSIAAYIAQVMNGAHLLAYEPDDQARFLHKMLNSYGVPGRTWHPQHLDLASFAAAAWGSIVPVTRDKIMGQIPLEGDGALAEAQWQVAVYNFIVAGG